MGRKLLMLCLQLHIILTQFQPIQFYLNHIEHYLGKAFLFENAFFLPLILHEQTQKNRACARLCLAILLLALHGLGVNKVSSARHPINRITTNRRTEAPCRRVSHVGWHCDA